jgi:uncharacterized membrane protein
MKSLASFVKSTLIGGIFFLIPFVLLIVILTKAYDIMLKVAQPLSDVIPLEKIGGVTIANILVVLLILLCCFLAGLIASRPKFKSAQDYLEQKILGPVPGYRVVKAYLNSLELYESREEKMAPVLVALDRHEKLGFEMERTTSGKVVVYLPGSPNFISGTVIVVTSEQVTELSVSLTQIKDAVEQFGYGVSELMSIPESGE